MRKKYTYAPQRCCAALLAVLTLQSLAVIFKNRFAEMKYRFMIVL